MTNLLKFSKMQGLGNDFMVIDATQETITLSTEEIRFWANRYFGVGFDQLLMVENSTQADVDFRYRIFNADGSEVQQCGNGARCFAKFVYDKGLTDKTEIRVETASGMVVLYITEQGWVRVNMGAPNFLPQALPFDMPLESEQYELDVDGERFEIGAVSMGNPHAVLRVSDLGAAPVAEVGEKIESHRLFPERVNVGFAETLDRQHIKLRVYERGAAETLACGTGACAAMVVLRNLGEVDDVVTVSLPGGDLEIEWNGDKESPVWMTGPAVHVFDGEIARGVPA
ncbi:diaminopimelate epimerase [Hydrogenovibrio sp. 3SP14C1]|uniref:diaminopimelate epimerase n=1 Tax=Hydrogenovibrio sp. 3SP14C1 TaxID=3038774 RepID=UPI002415C1CF|nr:diaminopimelate epimerase [Hydrogenovibrio sp. 3SP14C1]MDG4811989.1 diaminopimelate epimerase [Hydrogenovibrio sp. 3SP14C1]